VHPRFAARLASEFTHRGDRPTYHPALLSTDSAGGPIIAPLRWAGSADLRGLAAANALAIFPAGDHTYAAGEAVEVQRL
jgi:molybdopterin biosynthesis enzyme